MTAPGSPAPGSPAPRCSTCGGSGFGLDPSDPCPDCSEVGRAYARGVLFGLEIAVARCGTVAVQIEAQRVPGVSDHLLHAKAGALRCRDAVQAIAARMAAGAPPEAT